MSCTFCCEAGRSGLVERDRRFGLKLSVLPKVYDVAALVPSCGKSGAGPQRQQVRTAADIGVFVIDIDRGLPDWKTHGHLGLLRDVQDETRFRIELDFSVIGGMDHVRSLSYCTVRYRVTRMLFIDAVGVSRHPV